MRIRRRSRAIRSLLFVGPLLAAFAASLNEASACRCVIKGPFLANAAEAEIVIRASVAANAYAAMKEGEGIELIVDEVMKGRVAEGRVKLTVRSGNDCPPEPRGLTPGTSWIIALERPHPTYGYIVRSCGIYWVRVLGRRVEGKITSQDSDQTISLLDLRAEIKRRQRQ